MLGKFKHISEEQALVLQAQVDHRMKVINALSESG
jgi:hypothetical protein